MKRCVRFVFLSVLASALVGGCSTRSEQERQHTLKQDLQMMRRAIDNYTLDKEKPPQSLADLVNGHYLKEIPTDPFTQKKDWALQFDRVMLSPEQSSTG
jgi:general secretion pathway protein G